MPHTPLPHIQRNLYLLVACAILPALAIIFYSGVDQRLQVEQEARKDLDNLCGQIASVQTERVRQSKVILQSLSVLPEVMELDATRCAVLFQQLRRDNLGLANIVLMDAKGIVRAASLPFSGIIDNSDRTAFKQAVANRDFSVGDYIVGRIQKVPAMQFSYPVFDYEGLLCGVLFLSYYLDVYHQYFESIELPPGSRIVLADRGGVRLVSLASQDTAPPTGEAIQPHVWRAIMDFPGDIGATTQVRNDGVEALIHFRKLRLSPGDSPYMVVIANSPRDAVLAGARGKFAASLAFLAAAGLVAMLVARMLGRALIGRQVEAMAKVNAELAQAKSRAEEAAAGLQREQALLKAIIEGTSDAIFVKDGHGVYQLVNQAFAARFGERAEDIPGRHARDLLPREQATEALEADRLVMASGQAIRYEQNITTVEGERQVYLSVKGPLYDDRGRVTGVFGISRDITQIKQTQEHLRQAKEQAESANRAKSEFLANMSHEIRTPLNGIMGSLQILECTSLDATQQDFVQGALSASGRLTRLLADILDLSRIEADKMYLCYEEFAVEELKKSVADLLGIEANTKGVALEIEVDPRTPPRLIGDEHRLLQVLFNLVGNAVKFSDGGAVRLTVAPLAAPREGAARLLFTVSDHGIGIGDELLPLIAKPFVQGDGSLRRRFQGAGLGMAIVLRLVTLMEGNISIESEQGAGTSIYVSIPFALPAPGEENGPGGPGCRLSPGA